MKEKDITKNNETFDDDELFEADPSFLDDDNFINEFDPSLVDHEGIEKLMKEHDERIAIEKQEEEILMKDPKYAELKKFRDKIDGICASEDGFDI